MSNRCEMDTSRIEEVLTRRAQPPSSSACRMSSAVGGRSLFSRSFATSALALLATKDAARACSTALRSCSFCASWAAMSALVPTPRGDDGVCLLPAARGAASGSLCYEFAAARRAFLLASVLPYASPSCQLIKHLALAVGLFVRVRSHSLTSKLLQTFFKQKSCISGQSLCRTFRPL